MSKTAVAGIALALSLACVNSAQAEENTAVRFGAKVIKQDLVPAKTTPNVKVLDNAEDWRLVEEEGFTGTNSREFFFTLEAKRKLPPPRVEVTWPGVSIARVIGAADKTEEIANGVRFTLHRGKNATSVKTMLDYGPFMRMAIFHNWEIRRLGNYKEGKWPADSIQAQLNFFFAAREMCRAMGVETTKDLGYEGAIHLYGFETNYPNQHVDAPPHFHILLAWPGWTGTQVTHFRLNEKGRITHNDYHPVDGKEAQNRKFGHGEVCAMFDPNGKQAFELVITDGGRGVIMRESAGKPEYRLSPDAKTDSAVQGVEVHHRDGPMSEWKPIAWVRAEDDAATGVLRVIVKPTAGATKEELIHYDPDTGREYSLTQYLEQIGDHRQDFTLFSGLSHPDLTGRDGHSSSQTWLTAATHPGLPGFKNTISVDQFLAERIGLATRFPSIQSSTSGSCQSCSRSGITLQSESIPSVQGTRRTAGVVKNKTEAGSRLIDNTAILFGSNLGNANSHDTRNLPILLAGGPFKHGRHIKLNAEENTPLSNLFVQTAARIAPDLERFGTSTSATVPGFV